MGVGAGLYMHVVVVQKFTFAISSPDEFLFYFWARTILRNGWKLGVWNIIIKIGMKQAVLLETKMRRYTPYIGAYFTAIKSTETKPKSYFQKTRKCP